MFGKLEPAKPPKSKTLVSLREQLRDEDFEARIMAARQLVDLGIDLTKEEITLTRRINRNRLPANASSLEDALAKGYAIETFMEPAAALLPLPRRVRESRTIAALERCVDSSARLSLEALANGHPDSPFTKEAAAALGRVEARQK